MNVTDVMTWLEVCDGAGDAFSAHGGPVLRIKHRDLEGSAGRSSRCAQSSRKVPGD